jgi:hypothetical protein
MLHEFAVEPLLLSNWKDFRFFVSHFGVDQGRLISRFPRKWKKLVYESLSNCRPIERSRIVEALQRLDDKMIPRSPVAWDAEADWLGNAEIEHAVRPFRAIICDNNVRQHPAMITGDSIDDTIDPSSLPEFDPLRLWHAPRSRMLNRQAPEMADAIDVLLREAQTIFFVDKYFGPENPRHRKPFEEFMSRVAARDSSKLPDKVEYHCAAKSELSFFRQECEMRIAPMIPVGVSVTFHRWAPSDLHNRYVLTELGGVAFLEGLDQDTGSGRKQDVVCLLDKDVSDSLMPNYIEGSTDYTHRDACTIPGSLIKDK